MTSDNDTISLYDTLTGEVRPLKLREPGHVDMYVCGPTVYDHPHLGHARSAITYDVLRRYLEWSGLKVRHVANVTDIDDKIIGRARNEGRSEAEVAQHWEAVYFGVMASLGVLEPHERPRATEWVAQMVAFITAIIDAGAAYTTPTGVYLRVRDVDGYGDLVHRSLDDLRASAGARVEVDEAKEDPLDFALWKAAKPDEPSWPSPWGSGRPGWHIECVAMSLGILGDDFDIHGGGNDLVFPHHTNERAEASAAGRPFARHWVHNAMLNVEGTKMAKSLGNYRTVADLLDEHPLNARAFRLLVLQTHYRKTMEVNAELMASARAAVSRIDALARRAEALGPQGDAPGVAYVESEQRGGPAREHDEQSSAAGVELDEATAVQKVRADVAASGAQREARQWSDRFQAAMHNDLGTPLAVARLFDALRRANASLDSGTDEARILVDNVADLAGVLGLVSDATEHGADTGDAAIESLITRRQAAREAKDWATADSLREELSALGAVVEDTPAGPIWHRQ